MQARITETQLVRLLQGINRAEGRPVETVRVNEDGTRAFNVGNLCIDGAYGGVAVVELTSENGAQTCHYPSSSGGHVPKREVYTYLRGRLDAAEYAASAARMAHTSTR